MSAAFSAIMMVGALVLPEVMVGIIDASTTHKQSTLSLHITYPPESEAGSGR